MSQVDFFNEDIDQVKQYLAVNVDNHFNTIRPYLNDSWDFILPVLSREQLAQLKTDYDLNSTDPAHLALLDLVKKAQVHFAYWLYSSDGTITITDSGFLQVEESGRKSAYQWHVRDFRNQRREMAWQTLNSILNLMLSDRDAYEPWSTSLTYADIMESFVVTVEDFTRTRRISGLSTLWALRPSLIEVQRRVISKNIGSELLDDLKEAYLDDDMTEDQKKLLSFIRPVITHLAVDQASPEMNFVATDQGLRVESVQPVGDTSYKNDAAARMDSFNVRQDAKKRGERALRELREFLDTNASGSRFQSYYNSDLYSPGEQETFTQSKGGTFLAV